jgi:hypothetical protein
LESELELPELFPADAEDRPDDPDPLRRVEGGQSISPEGIRLVIPKVGSYLASGGARS